MSFRDTLLQKALELGLDEDLLAKQLVEVIKGETITEVYEKQKVIKLGDGTEQVVMRLKRRTVVRKPEDQLRGLVIADTLQGGDLGLAPKDRRLARSGSVERVHKRIKQDNRVIVDIPGILPVQGKKK